MEELIKEIREDFQVAPYYPDTSLQRLVEEGEASLLQLNPGRDYNTDKVYRSLLKNYVYYGIHHIVSDFFSNYSQLILTWQLETEIETT